MTPSARLLKQPETFRRLTGLTPVAFERLLADVTAARGRPRCGAASATGGSGGSGRVPRSPWGWPTNC